MPKLPQHPFPFLLRLEWFVLSSVLIDLLMPRLSDKEFNPIVAFIATVCLGIQGFYIPSSWHKYPYTVVSLILIILIVSSGGTPRFFFTPSIVLVMRSCYMFDFWGRFAIAGLALTFMWHHFSQRAAEILLLLNRPQSFTTLAKLDLQALVPILRLGFLFLYGMCIFFVLITIDALLSERKHRERLNLAHEQLREYAMRIEGQATLEERNRIAREIHDSLGHHLTALNIQLETGIKLLNLDPDRAKQFLLNAKTTGSQTLQAVRDSVGQLRKEPLGDKPLEIAIQDLCLGLQNSINAIPQCEIKLPKIISKELQWVIFRVVQESLTNICKHAIENDRELVVEIKIIADYNQLNLEVIDNGRGFYVDQNISGFGLKGMEERVNAVGGLFRVISSPGNGCQVIVQIPWTFNSYTDREIII